METYQQKFFELVSFSEKLPVQHVIDYMNFDSRKEYLFLNWAFYLPLDNPIIMEGDLLAFYKTEDYQTAVTEQIDRLLLKFQS